MGTPPGTVEWAREFRLGPDLLAFEAALENRGQELVARVVERHGQAGEQPGKDIFHARWVVDHGAWRFQEAHLDGAVVAEQAAIAIFRDYLVALATEPVIREPVGCELEAPARKRPRFG